MQERLPDPNEGESGGSQAQCTAGLVRQVGQIKYLVLELIKKVTSPKQKLIVIAIFAK